MLAPHMFPIALTGSAPRALRSPQAAEGAFGSPPFCSNIPMAKPYDLVSSSGALSVEGRRRVVFGPELSVAQVRSRCALASHHSFRIFGPRPAARCAARGIGIERLSLGVFALPLR